MYSEMCTITSYKAWLSCCPSLFLADMPGHVSVLHVHVHVVHCYVQFLIFVCMYTVDMYVHLYRILCLQSVCTSIILSVA